MRDRYVLGFVISEHEKTVLLMEKARPEWQKGKLNGIGGKIEKDDVTPRMAMVREAAEEVAIYDEPGIWRPFGTLSNADFEMFVYHTRMEVHAMAALEGQEDEPVDTYPIHRLPELNTISNIPWLVHACLDDHLHEIDAHYA